MPRRARRSLGGYVYHVLNRGNCRMDIFDKPADFAAFVKLLEEARKRVTMRILAFCLMHNHWHLVLWPRRDGDLSRFIGWLCTTHVRRWRQHRGNVSEGHLYQCRFKSFVIERDEHLVAVIRYVEANPLRPKLVKRAQNWRWSSLGDAIGAGGVRVKLEPWPVDRPRDWSRMVNDAINDVELSRLRASVARGRPFGGDGWVKRAVKKLGLESTMRDPWRPRKVPTRGRK